MAKTPGHFARTLHYSLLRILIPKEKGIKEGRKRKAKE